MSKNRAAAMIKSPASQLSAAWAAFWRRSINYWL